LRELAEAAAGDMGPKAGRTCIVSEWKEVDGANQISRAFELKSAAGTWMVFVRDETRPRRQTPELDSVLKSSRPIASSAGTGPGYELLLDVELEAALRFGCRELPLGEILDLGAGDVVELDRHIADPVDLLVGDRIVARGEVVLVNGNFGLRVTEVATPVKRLESIRCLF
jgi:flagellar motor switch protein FliN